LRASSASDSNRLFRKNNGCEVFGGVHDMHSKERGESRSDQSKPEETQSRKQTTKKIEYNQKVQ
jgi:hypothetical protein